VADLLTTIENLLTGGGNWLTGGFNTSPTSGPGTATGLAGLLGGATGSTNPIYDIMAILSFINEGQLTQEQMGFIKNTLNQQSSSLGTATNPNALSAWRTATTPRPMGIPGTESPTQYADTINQLTNRLTQPFIYNTLNPVQANLAAQGQATSPTTSQYVSEQALAPYNIQEQQLAQTGANTLLSDQLQRDQMALNQYMADQQMGQNLTQFGLQLPFQANPVYPTFGVMNPSDINSLMSLIGGNPGSFNFGNYDGGGSFNPGNASNQLYLTGASYGGGSPIP
jgi:hypothetical protein